MKQKITAVRTILLRGFACILSTVFGISFLLNGSAFSASAALAVTVLENAGKYARHKLSTQRYASTLFPTLFLIISSLGFLVLKKHNIPIVF